MTSLPETRGLGRAFAGYLAWTARQARWQNAECIWFLSREGHWFARQYELMRQLSAQPGKYPPARHLPVSRLSTFLPSLEKIDEEALEPLLKQYGKHSTGAILGSLGFFHSAPRELIESLRHEGLLERPWKDSGKQILARRHVRECLERRRTQQRHKLLAYLDQKSFAGISGHACVADIGWRGSIQDNLARLLPKVRLTGLYFHLQPFFVQQAENTDKYAFINEALGSCSHKTMRRLRFAAPLEFMVMDYKNGTITGYESDNGFIKEITAPPILPSHYCKLDFLRSELESEVGKHTLDTFLSPQDAVNHVLQYLECPSKEILELFFSMPRDDLFGAGKVAVGADKISYISVLKAFFNRDDRILLGQKLAESGWPWGLLWRDVPVLAPFLIKLLLLWDIRLP